MVGQVPANVVGVSAIEPPAFYGKLPGHGDFVGRGLTSAQEAAIDSWLAAWIGATRASWEGGFEKRYREAQPWLFGGGRLTAIAIPSSDRIGRLFPLLAAARAGVPLQSLYDTAVAAIAEAWTGDRLFAALDELVADEAGVDDAPGWLVPDAKKCTMPHPLRGAGGETIGAMLA